MVVIKDVKINEKEYLKDRILSDYRVYCKEKNFEVNEFNETLVINTLLNGYNSELSGLTAIRGFIFQYYATVNYVVDMLFSPNCWWEEVIFELIDDIALHNGSEKRIRFVQVKTEREDSTARNLTEGSLYERSKDKNKKFTKFDSWIDKLFLNYKNFNQKLNNIASEEEIKEYIIQFELFTNSLCNKDLSIYEENELFYLPNDKATRSQTERILNKINIPLKDGEVLEEELSINPEWCLKRFKIGFLGRSVELRENIIRKIMSITDSSTYDTAAILFKKLLVHVIENTYQDNVRERELYVFTKQEVRDFIDNNIDAAELEVYNNLQRKVPKSKFDKAILNLFQEFKDSKYKNIRKDLLEALDWIEKTMNSISEKEPLFYHSFLHRLFYMKAETSLGPITGEDIPHYLQMSLAKMTIYLALYENREFLLSETNLLIKRNKSSESKNGNSHYVFFSGRDKEKQSTSLIKLLHRIKEESVIPILDNIYAFIMDTKQTDINIENPFNFGSSITQVEKKEKNIVKVEKNIKIYDHNFLNYIEELFLSLTNEISLKESKVRTTYYGLLEQKDLKIGEIEIDE